MNDTDSVFMRMALKEAEFFLRADRFPVGAIVVSDGKIIGRSNEEIFASRRFNHAETVAIYQSVREKRDKDLNLDEVTIYTTLEPCIMCFGFILHCRLKRVVYALEDPYGGATGLEASSMPPCLRTKLPKITSGVLREESRQLIKKFLSTTGDLYWKNNCQSPLFKLCMDE